MTLLLRPPAENLLSYGSLKPSLDDDEHFECHDNGGPQPANEETRIDWKACLKYIGMGATCFAMICLFGRTFLKRDDVFRFRSSPASHIPMLASSLVDSRLAEVAVPDPNPVLVSGFSNNFFRPQNPEGVLHWYCAPDSWKDIPETRREGRGGSWSLDDTDLVLTPPAKKDYWRKTYYDPIVIKDDAPFLYAKLPTNEYYTVETTLELIAVRQFDQAGLMIRLGPQHWLKAGIEVVDQQPRLSCVVTNGYSDWSTQTWSNFTVESTSGVVRVYCQIRVHIRGTSFVVAAKMPPTDDWQFIRIAHLSRCMTCQGDPMLLDEDLDGTLQDASPGEDELWAGVFAASPEDQQGGQARFSNFEIRRGSRFDHNADGNEDA